MSERTRDEWLALVYARAEHLRWRRRLIAGGVALGLVIAVLVPTVVFSGGNKAKKLNVASGPTSTTTAAGAGGGEGVVYPVPGEAGTAVAQGPTTTVPGTRSTATTRRSAAPAAGPTTVPHLPLPNPIAFSANNVIWLVNDDGRGLRRISAGNHDYGPVWSPDGSAVLFWRNTTGSQLFVANTDGSGERMLAYGDSPSLSPDGSQLAFDSQVNGGVEISVMKRDGTGAHVITTGPQGPPDGHAVDNHLPAWSPDGSRIAFACGSQLCTVNPDGSDRQALTSSGFIEGPPVWSPDSSLIAFPLSEQAPTTEIYAIGRDGTGLRKMSATSSASSSRPYGIAWAPDSSRLAHDGDGIWIVNRDGTGGRQISGEQWAQSAGWSPDGRHILFVVHTNGEQGTLYTIEPTGEHQVEIVDGSHNVESPAVYGPKPVP